MSEIQDLLQQVGSPVPRVCYSYNNKTLQTRWLKQQKSTVSQFWKLKVYDPGARRLGSSCKENLFHALSPGPDGFLAIFGILWLVPS